MFQNQYNYPNNRGNYEPSECKSWLLPSQVALFLYIIDYKACLDWNVSALGKLGTLKDILYT